MFLCIGFVHLEPCILSIHDKMKSCSPDSELFHGEENGVGNGDGRFLKFGKVWVRQATLKKQHVFVGRALILRVNSLKSVLEKGAEMGAAFTNHGWSIFYVRIV